MQRRAHFIRLYRSLDLPDSATLEDLKYRYHVLAARYHPDKAGQESTDDDPAEQFKVIQAAYRDLRRYHDAHGYLPLSITQSELYPPIAIDEAKPKNKRPSIFVSILLGIMGFLFLLTLIYTPSGSLNPDSDKSNQTYPLYESNLDETKSRSLVHHDNTMHRNTQDNPLKLGMTMGQTFELLGVPDATVGDHWFYGDAEVYFRDGRVAGWNNRSDSPIHTDCTLPAHVTPLPRRENR